MIRLIALSSAALALIGWLPLAQAHIDLVWPSDMFNNSEGQKSGPCGPSGTPTPEDKMYYFAPGASVTVRVNETISHPGHFRVAISDDVNDFVNPAAVDDFNNTAHVIADNILPDRSLGGIHDFSVTMPAQACDGCVMQVIQLMTDKPPYEQNGNDLYYRCANVTVVDNPPDNPDTPDTVGQNGNNNNNDGGGGDDGGGCNSSGRGTGSGIAFLVLLAGAALLARRPQLRAQRAKRRSPTDRRRS
jgi:uncharacterized protein (TIGR03382 family)